MRLIGTTLLASMALSGLLPPPGARALTLKIIVHRDFAMFSGPSTSVNTLLFQKDREWSNHMICHFLRHHPRPECIPLLTCHLHQGLIAHGEHLTHRCSGWSEDLHRQRGWAPEVA